MKVLFTVVEPNIDNNYNKPNVIVYIHESDFPTDSILIAHSLLETEEQKIISSTETCTKESKNKVRKSKRDSNKQLNEFVDTC